MSPELLPQDAYPQDRFNPILQELIRERSNFNPADVHTQSVDLGARRHLYQDVNRYLKRSGRRRAYS